MIITTALMITTALTHFLRHALPADSLLRLRRPRHGLVPKALLGVQRRVF